MAEVTLTATTGRTTGSSASRRMRADGLIPATVYGMGTDAVSVTITRADLRKAMTTDAGVNALIKLEIDGAATEFTLVKEIQRHTVRREVIHVDFLRIDPHKAMVLDVPDRPHRRGQEGHAAAAASSTRSSRTCGSRFVPTRSRPSSRRRIIEHGRRRRAHRCRAHAPQRCHHRPRPDDAHRHGSAHPGRHRGRYVPAAQGGRRSPADAAV